MGDGCSKTEASEGESRAGRARLRPRCRTNGSRPVVLGGMHMGSRQISSDLHRYHEAYVRYGAHRSPIFIKRLVDGSERIR
jgi:hypothetical protein